MSGVPELLILRLLSAREMYGYELVRSIRLVSKDAIILAEGVVYPVLHAMEAQGFLRTRKKAVNNRSRVYYTLTARGRKRLETLQGEWERVSSGVNSFMGEFYA